MNFQCQKALECIIRGENRPLHGPQPPQAPHTCSRSPPTQAKGGVRPLWSVGEEGEGGKRVVINEPKSLLLLSKKSLSDREIEREGTGGKEGEREERREVVERREREERNRAKERDERDREMIRTTEKEREEEKPHAHAHTHTSGTHTRLHTHAPHTNTAQTIAHTSTHIDTLGNTHADTHTHAHTEGNTHADTHTQGNAHTNTSTHTHSQRNTRTPGNTHTNINIHSHSQGNAHTQGNTHTNTTTQTHSQGNAHTGTRSQTYAHGGRVCMATAEPYDDNELFCPERDWRPINEALVNPLNSESLKLGPLNCEALSRNCDSFGSNREGFGLSCEGFDSKQNSLSQNCEELGLKHEPLSVNCEPLDLKLDPLSLNWEPLYSKHYPLSQSCEPSSWNRDPYSPNPDASNVINEASNFQPNLGALNFRPNLDAANMVNEASNFQPSPEPNPFLFPSLSGAVVNVQGGSSVQFGPRYEIATAATASYEAPGASIRNYEASSAPVRITESPSVCTSERNIEAPPTHMYRNTQSSPALTRAHEASFGSIHTTDSNHEDSFGSVRTNESPSVCASERSIEVRVKNNSGVSNVSVRDNEALNTFVRNSESSSALCARNNSDVSSASVRNSDTSSTTVTVQNNNEPSSTTTCVQNNGESLSTCVRRYSDSSSTTTTSVQNSDEPSTTTSVQNNDVSLSMYVRNSDETSSACEGDYEILSGMCESESEISLSSTTSLTSLQCYQNTKTKENDKNTSLQCYQNKTKRADNYNNNISLQYSQNKKTGIGKNATTQYNKDTSSQYYQNKKEITDSDDKNAASQCHQNKETTKTDGDDNYTASQCYQNNKITSNDGNKNMTLHGYQDSSSDASPTSSDARDEPTPSEPAGVDNTAGNRGIHINIHTPPINPPNFYQHHCQPSTPIDTNTPTTSSATDTNTQAHTPLGLPRSGTAESSSTFNIGDGGSLVIGPQIVITHPPGVCTTKPVVETNPHPVSLPSSENSSQLDSLLSEVRDRLSTVYIRQTKTSFLPWLKGHQVIPMTEFYTESRILALDKQGRQTKQCVDLVKDLVTEEETRYLVEGEPGMGKTLLALKLAIDWAQKRSLTEFKFAFLIFLRDFKGSLERYVKEELLPSHFDEKFKQVWDYCKEHEDQVLFILDGYDELEQADQGDIKRLLLNHQDFQRSKVVVTARPDVLQTIAQRTIVKGFNDQQMIEFISKYFKLVNEEENGRNLMRIIEKDPKYKKLARRPLFCVLLCMLYGSDGVGRTAKLPQKLSEVMFKITLCLIKWNVKKVVVGTDDRLSDAESCSAIDYMSTGQAKQTHGHTRQTHTNAHTKHTHKHKTIVDENTDEFPAQYRELFLAFGKLCLQALRTEKTRFSEKEIRGIENQELLLHLGFLSNDGENDMLGHKKFWKPVHKIFLEYMAALYMSNHIERDRSECRECREYPKLYQKHEHILKFVVGVLGKKAHLALDSRKHQTLLQLQDHEILQLLRETELTRDNCRAVARLLDRRSATVYTSEVDFEGWSCILAQNFKKLKNLEIVWRIKSSNPDQESSFSEATPQMYRDFFTALRSNHSITKISIRATQDGEPFSHNKIDLFFTHLALVLTKCNLRELEIKELKMRVSENLRTAFETATGTMDKKALESLETLKLDMYLRDEDLEVMCDRLRLCATNLRELQLTGLEHGSAGFRGLVDLLRKSKSLQKLCLSMNKESLMVKTKVFMRKKCSDNLTPSDMHTGTLQMPRHATQRSRDVFRSQEPEGKRSSLPSSQASNSGNSSCSSVTSALPDPTRELSYLFQDHLHTGIRYSPALRGYYFIAGGGETRLPLPLCIPSQHHSVFHPLFLAIGESTLESLTLDYPCLYLSVCDLVCLGDVLRKAKHLARLKLMHLKTIESYMPVLLGLGQSQSLKTVRLESNSVVLTDIAFHLTCTALRNNTALRSLSLAQWTFNLQDKSLATLYFQDLLSSWKVIDLDLTNCSIDLSTGVLNAPTLLPPILPPIPAPMHHWGNVKTARLAEIKLRDYPGFLRRGHLLVPFLRSFPNLTHLDLSASHTQPTALEDNAACMFFRLVSTHLRKIQELVLGNWEFRFSRYEETCVQIGNCVRACGYLRILVLDKVCEMRVGSCAPALCRHTFLHQLVNHLPKLSELSLCYYKIDRCEFTTLSAANLGVCFHSHWASSVAKFKLKFFGLSHAVEGALCDALRREGVSVCVTQGYPLVITVKRGYFMRR